MNLGLDQRNQFLDRLREGKRIDVAAAEVGSTASEMRRMARRDEDFGLQLAAALEERREAHCDRIRKELDERAFDREDRASFHALKLEAEMHLPELEHKRTKTVLHGNDGEPFRIQAVLPEVSQEFLDQIPLPILEDLLAKLKAIETGDIQKLHELTQEIGL
jgi:hypothetical protein